MVEKSNSKKESTLYSIHMQKIETSHLSIFFFIENENGWKKEIQRTMKSPTSSRLSLFKYKFQMNFFSILVVLEHVKYYTTSDCTQLLKMKFRNSTWNV